ncbi:MAG: sigma-70 family RNA polymerase sigma factor [Desulfitobacteriaceae bacterium]
MSAVTSSKNTEDQNVLLEAARSGDQKSLSELIQRYEPEVRKIACKYFLPKADHDDLIQEGRIAIYKAVMAYNNDSTIPFLHFLRMVIKRKLIDCLREHNRQKHVNFNDAFSLNSTLTDNHEDAFLNIISDFGDPAATVVAIDEARCFIQDLSKELSQLECMVFQYHFVDGLKQREVSERLGLHPKSLDNAIQRIRRKTILYRSRQVAG